MISHVDHGKSTLADRLLEMTGTIERRNMREQVLDAMDLEREKGITIKLTPVRMQHGAYVLNLIDTPGHVDFSYEVSRSLAAVEGALLLVDATQGIQAQTLANLDLAKRAGLTILPIVNKIDLPSSDVEATRKDISTLTGIPEERVLLVSAKTGQGVTALLDAIVERVPPPGVPLGFSSKIRRGAPPAPQSVTAFRGLIFDSVFDTYQGVVVYVRVMSGAVRKNERLTFAASGADASAIDLGTFRPEPASADELGAGEIGYVATGLRDVALARVGDTLLHELDRGRVPALPGYAVPQPNVYAGVYPLTGEAFQGLREAIEKLRLSDASLASEPEQSPALGQGFRCGFLGLLHVEIVRERLKREYGIEVTLSVPSVAYRIILTNGSVQTVRRASEFPDPAAIRETWEPWVNVTVLARAQDIGAVLPLFSTRGGSPETTESLAGGRVAITGDVPLREVVVNFHDDLKAATSGYGSFSTRTADERPVDLAKISILANHEPVEALSVLVPKRQAEDEGRRMVEKLKTAIPRHLFAIPLQAAIGGKVIARETIPALRKDVTGHLYGGDVTRKRKLLEKQKKGKKKLASRGSVQIPPAAYLAVLRR